jgi:hypothetical protein
LLKAGVADARECLRYALSLPIAVVITGCENAAILEQALDVGRRFQPLGDEERRALLAKSAPLAAKGKYELFKTTDRFDGTTHNPRWLVGASP